MINGLKQTIYKANNPSTVVARLENYAPILLLNQGITMGRKAITHSAFSRAKEEFMCKGMQEEAAKQMASRKIAEEGAALSAGAITGLTIAAVAAIGLYGIYKLQMYINNLVIYILANKRKGNHEFNCSTITLSKTNNG